MAITPTLRFLLKQYGSGGDAHPNRAEFNAMIDALENNAAMFSQGITAARPAAGKRGRFYWDETVSRLYYDTGTDWKDANPNGGGGAGLALAIGGAGSEGTSARAARADHAHPLPLATGTAHGAMSAADKAKLDAGTSAANADALVRRDVSSRISVGTPTAGAHATTKTYVDGLITETAAYAEGLIDDVSFVCTSTTRPAHIPARRIFETDTKITRYSDGNVWHAIHMPFKQYPAQWNGLSALGGAGFVTAGEWAIIGPETVRVSGFMIAGAGASMGTGRLNVSLPVKVAPTGVIQLGEGAHMAGSVSGPQARFIVAAPSGASLAEIWHAPMSGNYAGYRTLGEAGYPWYQGCNLHFQMVYKAELTVA